MLVNALGSNTCLRKVDLSGNGLEDSGAKMLSKALQINTTLRWEPKYGLEGRKWRDFLAKSGPRRTGEERDASFRGQAKKRGQRERDYV